MFWSRNPVDGRLSAERKEPIGGEWLGPDLSPYSHIGQSAPEFFDGGVLAISPDGRTVVAAANFQRQAKHPLTVAPRCRCVGPVIAFRM